MPGVSASARPKESKSSKKLKWWFCGDFGWFFEDM
jgi:hypothetical protein